MSDKSGIQTEEGREDENVKIGLSVKASVNVQKVKLIILGFLLGISLSFLTYGSQHPDSMWMFLAVHIFLPMFLVTLVNTFCVLYSIFAWTRTSIRYVFVDVFYLTTFSKLINIFYCVYMLVIVLSSHHIVTHGEGIVVVTLPQTYLIVAGIVLSYALINDLITIAFLSSLYFKLGNVVKSLSKYYILKRFFNGGINLVIFGYYTFSLATESTWSWLTFTLMMLCLTSVMAEIYLIVMFFKHRQPNSQPAPPADLKIQTAVKIVKMKEEVKAVAAASA